MCACRVSHVLSADDCGDFAHVRASSCDSADRLKIVSKIVIFDLQSQIFLCWLAMNVRVAKPLSAGSPPTPDSGLSAHQALGL